MAEGTRIERVRANPAARFQRGHLTSRSTSRARRAGDSNATPERALVSSEAGHPGPFTLHSAHPGIRTRNLLGLGQATLPIGLDGHASGWPASNRRPPPWRGGALPAELHPRGAFGPARTGCLPFTRRPLYLVSYEGMVRRQGLEPRIAGLRVQCCTRIARGARPAIRGGGPQGRRTRSPPDRPVRPSSHRLGRRRRAGRPGRAGDGPLRLAPCRLG